MSYLECPRCGCYMKKEPRCQEPNCPCHAEELQAAPAPSPIEHFADVKLRSIEAMMGTLDHSAAIDDEDWRDQVASQVAVLVEEVRRARAQAAPAPVTPQGESATVQMLYKIARAIGWSFPTYARNLCDLADAMAQARPVTREQVAMAVLRGWTPLRSGSDVRRRKRLTNEIMALLEGR